MVSHITLNDISGFTEINFAGDISNLFEETQENPSFILNEIRESNADRLIIAHLSSKIRCTEISCA